MSNGADSNLVVWGTFMISYQILDDILDGSTKPVELTRISTFIDGVRIDAPALNDILIAHPNPAAISRCSFRCEILLALVLLYLNIRSTPLFDIGTCGCEEHVVG